MQRKQFLILATLYILSRPLAYIACAVDHIDSDGDGLTDFQETHKYFTDPNEWDTDSDGIVDSHWDERREYSYSISSILRIMPPLDTDALNDNYQDARVLDVRTDYIELEVIHYPFATPDEPMDSNPNWQHDYAGMLQYLNAGITTNWDPEMRQDLLRELQADGIIIENLTDRQVVEQVSSWLMRNSTFLDEVFTTYYVYYPDNEPRVYPGLERAFEHEYNRNRENYNWPIDRHFEYELLGRRMYYNRTHGSCTSTAVYLTTVLRAIGIPTRMIIVAPVVDPSDDKELRCVRKEIRHNHLRHDVLAILKRSGQGFTSHTLNEVYIGNRWHRLDYDTLGQNAHQPFVLSTHLYTFCDLSEVDLAPTWGVRYGTQMRDDIFGHGNPYSTVRISDNIGIHSNFQNPSPYCNLK